MIVDINADVGEGLNNESLLMPYLSSCNIACGGHAGDKESMRKVVKLAKQHKVKIGAHYTSLKQQIRSLMQVIRDEHATLHHVKPHGALYNLAAKDEKTANVIIEVVKSIAFPLYLYVPYGSVVAELARKEGVKITYEAFADRNYNEDLSLVSRSLPNAIITNPVEVFEHVKKMIFEKKVKTNNGVEVEINADTFCIHGDNPEALKLLQNLIKKLQEFQVVIQ